MKALIFDSGPLINLSMNGLLDLLSDLKNIFDGKFLITSAVKSEVIDRPIGIQRFELGALRVQELLNKRIIEMPSSLSIDEKVINSYTREIMDIANHYVQAEGRWVPIVSEAEMSCIALAAELFNKGIQNIIAIDERTTRILAENPANLEKLMGDKLHRRVRIIARDFDIFSKYKFIRSSELVYVAYKKGLISIKNKKILEALLYATKFKGASISYEEIEQLKKL